MKYGKASRRKHSKPGQTTLRAFHFRIEATATGNTKLHQALTLGWELRNRQALLLEQNRLEARAAKQRGDTPNYLSAFELKKSVASDCLPAKFAGLHSQVRQELSLRISEGQKRWLESLKKGGRVRPPKLIKRKKFHSLTYPQYGTAAHTVSSRSLKLTLIVNVFFMNFSNFWF